MMVNSIIANENANKYSVGVSNFKSMGHNTRTFANKQTNKQTKKKTKKKKKKKKKTKKQNKTKQKTKKKSLDKLPSIF